MPARADSESPATPPGLALLLGLCFVSGAAGLVYQVVWTQWLALSFGSSIVAASAVVAGFLGGTGVGAASFHRFGGSGRDPLRVYAAIEVAIALATLLVAQTFDALPALIGVAAGAVPAGLGMDLFRVAMVLALLLVPAAFMGATYPALCSVIVRSRSEADRELGWIYGINTLGAAAGAVTAGFVLVEWLGLFGTLLVANAMNLAVGAIAFFVSSRGEGGEGAVAAPPPDEPLPTSLPYRTTATLLLLSGMATIGYEILWFRTLRYLVGNSSYAVTTTLAVFLLGLGLGSMAYPRFVRRSPERTLAWVQLGTAICVLLALVFEEWILRTPALKSTFSIFGASLGGRSWWTRLGLGFGTSALLLLPGTFCMGLSFPLASRLYLGSVANVGRRAGQAYFRANLGSILGSIGTALFVLPTLGSVGGMQAFAALNVALGLWLFSSLSEPEGSAHGSERRGMPLGPIAACVAVVLLCAWLLPERLSFRGAGMAFWQGDLVFEEEGELATVQVRQQPEQAKNRAMLIDGTIIGVSAGWYLPLDGKQQVLAHLPVVLHPGTRDTLNVGLGSASTVEALARYASLERLDTVEINAAVVRGARFFDEGRVLDDPRAHVEVEDVLHALLRGRHPYDLIVSDGKQNEDFAGNARVLSAEFYRYARARLRDGGLLVQWIPLGTPAEDFRIILRTMLSEFPEVDVFFYMPESVILVGSERGLRASNAMSEERFEELGVGPWLSPLQITERDLLLAGWVASASGLREVVGDGPLNRWDRLVLEYGAYRVPRSHKRRSDARNLRLLQAARRRTIEAGDPFVDPGGEAARVMQLLRDAFVAYKDGNPREALAYTQRALAIRPGAPVAVAALRDFEGVLSKQQRGAGQPRR